MEKAVTKVASNAILVNPGQSLQEALDKVAGKNGWVIATAGIHTLPTTLKIPSGVTLSGEGLGTVLFLDPKSGVRDAIVNAKPDLHDVTICDFVLEGATDTDPGSDPNSRRSYRSTANRGGIMFLGQHEGQMKNISLRNITVRNCTYNGVFISGAENLNVVCCDFNENGASVVPGPKLQHNLLLSHCTKVSVKDSRMDTSPHGCGIALTSCSDVSVANCELARNAWFGVLVTESKNVSISGSLIEANDHSGIMVQYLYRGSENVSISNNLIHYNNGFGVEAYSGKNIKSAKNTFAGNGKDLKSNKKIVDEKLILMQ
jgi:parallel beta-helix repeat protein